MAAGHFGHETQQGVAPKTGGGHDAKGVAVVHKAIALAIMNALVDDGVDEVGAFVQRHLMVATANHGNIVAILARAQVARDDALTDARVLPMLNQFNARILICSLPNHLSHIVGGKVIDDVDFVKVGWDAIQRGSNQSLLVVSGNDEGNFLVSIHGSWGRSGIKREKVNIRGGAMENQGVGGSTKSSFVL